MKCKYCDEIAGRSDQILETKHWKVFLVGEQSYLGRCYIPLKRHCESLSDLKEDEWSDFQELVRLMEKALKSSFKATMFNWTCLMNDAYRERPFHPHVHWHFRPRYSRSVKFAGSVFEDPEFGHHYNKDRSQEVDAKTRARIIARIRKEL